MYVGALLANDSLAIFQKSKALLYVPRVLDTRPQGLLYLH